MLSRKFNKPCCPPTINLRRFLTWFSLAVDDLESLVEQLVSTLVDPDLTEDVQGILTLVDNIISEVEDAL